MFKTILEKIDGEGSSLVLDVGAGTGNLEFLGRNRSVKFIATDFSRSMLAILRLKNPNRSKVETILWNVNCELPAGVVRVDAIVCVNVIFTVTDLERFLRQMSKTLKESGSIFIVSPRSSFSIRMIASEHVRMTMARPFGIFILAIQIIVLAIPLLLLLVVNLLIETLFSSDQYVYFSEGTVQDLLQKLGYSVTVNDVLAGQEYMVIGRR